MRAACCASAPTPRRGRAPPSSRALAPVLLVAAAFLLDDDLVAFLDLAQDLERPGHDLGSDGRALLDLDHELAGDARLDLLESELAVLDDVDAFLGLGPRARRGLLVLHLDVAHDERLDRDRRRAVDAARDD